MTTTHAPLSAEQLTRYDYVPGEAGRMIIDQDDNGAYLLRSDVLALIAQARAAQPVQAGEAVDPIAIVRAAVQQLANSPFREGSSYVEGMVVGANMCLVRLEREFGRATLAPVAAQQAAAKASEVRAATLREASNFARCYDLGTPDGHAIADVLESMAAAPSTADSGNTSALGEGGSDAAPVAQQAAAKAPAAQAVDALSPIGADIWVFAVVAEAIAEHIKAEPEKALVDRIVHAVQSLRRHEAASPASTPEASQQAHHAAATTKQDQIDWGRDLQERLMAASQDLTESEDARQVMAEAACLLAALIGRPDADQNNKENTNV